MEAPEQGGVVEVVIERGQTHSLVMRHEGAHNGDVLTAWLAGRGVIQRLVESEAIQRALLGERAQIAPSRLRRKGQRQKRGVGRHDALFAQPLFEAKVRHAEELILIIELIVERIETGFGNAPRHIAPRAIINLRLNGRLPRLLQQRQIKLAHE